MLHWRLFAVVLSTAEAIRHRTTPRRRFLHSTAWLPAALVVPPTHAADEKSAVFSGGAACYLQPFFDEIRYKGVTRTEVGLSLIHI